MNRIAPGDDGFSNDRGQMLCQRTTIRLRKAQSEVDQDFRFQELPYSRPASSNI